MINVAICGLGTVGGGSLNLLQQQAATIKAKTNLDIKVSHIGWRSPKAQYDVANIETTTDSFALASHPDVDIVIELIGGVTVAKELVLKALQAGKHVVTANKQLLAEHGDEIFAEARANKVVVAFEAAVAGGIPIIKSLREGLVANDVNFLAGIINGTSNFILTEMAEKQAAFADVLKQAQDLGYAETDPTFDIEGMDAAHKLAIMARFVFGLGNCVESIYMQGISQITREDIAYAKELGFAIKHLGIAQKIAEGYVLKVHLALVPQSHLLANVNGVLNAVLANGNYSGQCLFTGAGAGAEATASAVVADVVQVARMIAANSYSTQSSLYVGEAVTDKQQVIVVDRVTSAYYLRIDINNDTEVMAAITNCLSQHAINSDEVLQKSSDTGKVSIVTVTHKVLEAKLNQALADIENLVSVIAPVSKLRVEYLT